MKKMMKILVAEINIISASYQYKKKLMHRHDDVKKTKTFLQTAPLAKKGMKKIV